MNLNAYDSMTPICKTWIDPGTKKLYSDEIPYYRCYTFLKRYNQTTKEDDYYIAFSNEETTDRFWYRTYLTKSKSIKVDLIPIWNISRLNKINVKQEVNVDIDSKSEDGVIYSIDI